MNSTVMRTNSGADIFERKKNLLDRVVDTALSRAIEPVVGGVIVHCLIISKNYRKIMSRCIQGGLETYFRALGCGRRCTDPS